ncbi:MAG: MATE family efflux transporter [Lachnospiraceae bacterium]
MDLLKDKVTTLYAKFLWPSLFAAMVTTVYSFVDTVAIGQGVGPNGAAAGAVVFPIFGVASLFGFLSGIGGSVRFGKAQGEGGTEKANAYYTASFLLTLILTIVVWPVTVICKEEIFTLFGANETLMPLVLEYGNWIIWTFPFFIFSAYLACMVRCDGAPNFAMWAVIAGGVFNVFGDWFLVFPMKMGMAGAAIATAGGTVIQTVILCAYLFTKNCRLRLVKPWKLSQALWKSVTSGFSASVLELAFIVLTCILNNQIMRYGGEVPLAVFSVVLTCSGMFQHIFTGVGQAIQPIITNNYGAGHMGRISQIRRISLVTVIGMGMFFSLSGILFPTQIVQFFVKTTPAVFEAAPGIVRTYFISFLFMGINIWATFYFQSIMRTRISSVLTLLRGVVISAVLLYLLPLWFGLRGVWWAMVFTECIVTIVTVICITIINGRMQRKNTLFY